MVGCVPFGAGEGLALVSNGLGDIQDIAEQAILNVSTTSGNLRNFIEGLTPVDVDIDILDAGDLSDPFTIGDPPVAAEVTFEKPVKDYEFELNVPDFNQTAVPPADFNEPTPELDVPARPGALTAEAPTNPPEVGDYPFPATPDDQIPSVPTLRPIIIPEFPTLTFEDWELIDPGEMPEIDAGQFNWSDDGYTPSVRQEVIDQIKAILGGSTGIPDRIWDMIEERARKQQRATARQAREEAVDFWAGRGEFLSNGQLRKRVKEAGDTEREGMSEVVRELVIQDAKIYVERLNNALAQGIALENHLVGLYNAQMDRSLLAARTVIELAIAVAQLRVSVYNTRIATYFQRAQAFHLRFQIEILKLEETKIKLDGQRLIGELNLQDLEAYKAQVTGITARYQLFESEVRSIIAKYDADKTRVAAFAELVKTFEAQQRAKEAEWRGYGEAVRAENLKFDAFKTLSDVHFNRVNAYKTNVDADNSVFDAYVKREQLQIDRLKVAIDELVANVQAEDAEVNATVKQQEIVARIYEATSRVEGARVSSDAQRLDVLARNANFKMQAQIQETQMKIQEAQNKIQAQLGGLNSILTAESSIGSSALAALNFGADIANTSSNAYSCNNNYAF